MEIGKVQVWTVGRVLENFPIHLLNVAEGEVYPATYQNNLRRQTSFPFCANSRPQFIPQYVEIIHLLP